MVTINDEYEVMYGLHFGDLEFDLDLYFKGQMACGVLKMNIT